MVDSVPASISGETMKIGITIYMLLEPGMNTSIKPARAGMMLPHIE